MVAPTPQSPAPVAGRPLTAEDVALLRKEDLLLCADRIIRAVEQVDIERGVVWFTDGDASGPSVLTFIGRPDADGWMPWSGGENPVPGQRVDYRMNNGHEGKGWLADNLRWTNEVPDHCIIAFRLSRPASEQPVEAIGAGREELVADLHRRADACHDLMKPGLSTRDAMRLHGKEAAYRHAAHLVNAALSPASPARSPMGGEVEALRGALEPFSEGARMAAISGRPPFEFCDAVDYERAAEALAASSPSPAQGGSDWKAEWEAVCSARIADRERSQEIINERDGWIVDLIGHRKALVVCVREAMKEAIPDAMIFAAHTDPKRWSKAKDDFQAWMKRSADLLDAIESERAAPPSVQPVEGK